MFRKALFASAITAVIASTACTGGTPTTSAKAGQASLDERGWGYGSGGNSAETTSTAAAADTVILREGGGAIGSGN